MMSRSRSRCLLVGAALTVLALVSASCTSAVVREANRLAQLPPLPYRIAIVGGAFLPESVREVVGRVPDAPSRSGATRDLWSRTFEAGEVEPIAFEEILRVLRRGRAATRVLDLAESADRMALATGDRAAIERARRRCEELDADLMVVVEGLVEGPVQYLGVTGQWPITTVAWLLAGIGLFVPDHRFESKAKMRASVVDVHSGKALMSRVILVPGSLELSLVGRSDFLGIVSSILVPPTLVGNDVETVVKAVRSEGEQRIVLDLLARLKEDETLETMRAEMPVRVELRVEGTTVSVDVRCTQELQEVLVQSFDASGESQPVDQGEFERFQRALLASVRRLGEEFVYAGSFSLNGSADALRIVVQDVAGQRASSTVSRSR